MPHFYARIPLLIIAAAIGIIVSACVFFIGQPDRSLSREKRCVLLRSRGARAGRRRPDYAAGVFIIERISCESLSRIYGGSKPHSYT